MLSGSFSFARCKPFLSLLAGSAVFPTLVGAAGPPRADRLPPNIIFILTDDQGWTDMSFPMDRNVPGSQSDYHRTPNMERLAQSGIRFSNGYTSAAVSSPSRRSIQFGETPIRQGSMEFADSHDPRKHELTTIPKALKAADPRYRTAHFGKWDFRANISPEDIGYDESDGNTGNTHGNLSRDPYGQYPPYTLVEDPKRVNHLTSRALNFIERQVARQAPFYVQISHYALHEGYQATQETFARYWSKRQGVKHADPGYAAMQEDLDTSIGVLLDALDRMGIRGNTYIFFVADNGAQESIPQVRPATEKMAHPSVFERRLRNWPLRGGKWVLYEGGIRVPFLAAGPGIVPDTQCDAPVAAWDLLPTFADLAGTKRPMPRNIDGVSIRPLLEQPDGKIVRPYDALFFHRYHHAYGHSAVRQGDYKLIRLGNGALELYDLKNDIGELNDISALHPDVCGRMSAALDSYMRSVDAEALKGFLGKPALKNTEE